MSGEWFAQSKQQIAFEQLSAKERKSLIQSQRDTSDVLAAQSYETQKNIDESRIKSLAQGLMRIRVSAGEQSHSESASQYFSPTGTDSLSKQTEEQNTHLKQSSGRWISTEEAQLRTGLSPDTSVNMAENNIVELHPLPDSSIPEDQEFTQTGPPPGAA
jgi:hypothetical protein